MFGGGSIRDSLRLGGRDESRATPSAARMSTVGLVLAMIVALASTVAAGSEPVRASPVSVEVTSELQRLLELPGDRVVVVPDGVHEGVSVDVSRPQTDGPLDGWLVLQAENRGGVVVRGDLELNSSASRILFVGFRFENARVFNHGEHIAYWYTDHVYPDVDWFAAGRPVPRQFFIRAPAQAISVLGSDFHDGVASPVTVTGAEQVRLSGVRIWNLSEPTGSDPEDRSHLNTISLVGGDVTDMVVADSTLVGARANHQTDKGDVVGLRYDNVWYDGAWGSAFQFNATQGHRIVDSTRVDVRSWGHVGNEPQDRIDVVAGRRIEPGSQPESVDVTDVDVALSAPDVDEVDPATTWRVEHPYESWREYFGWATAPVVEAPAAVAVAAGEFSSTDPTVDAAAVVPGAMGAILLITAWRRRRAVRPVARSWT